MKEKNRPLLEPLQPSVEVLVENKRGRGVRKMTLKKRGQWINQALTKAFVVVDNCYKIKDVSKNYRISKSTIKKHYLEKRK